MHTKCFFGGAGGGYPQGVIAGNDIFAGEGEAFKDRYQVIVGQRQADQPKLLN
jgi:hypothetical protein